MPIGTTTDYTEGSRSPLNIAKRGAIPYLELNAAGLDIKDTHRIYYIKSSNKDETYYFELIVEKAFPLYFAGIIHPAPITVRAGALVQLNHPFDESQLSGLERWGTLDKEELYNPEKDPPDVVDNSERLAADRKSLITIAEAFLGKTKGEIGTKLGYGTNNNKFTDKNFYGTTDGSADGVRTDATDKDKNYSTMLVEYFDTGTTGRNIFYNEKHISSQWLNGTYTNSNDTKWQNYRYFYSDQMIQTNPFETGSEYTYSNKIKTQFKTTTDENGNEVVTEVRIFVLRQKNILEGNKVKTWYTNVATDREMVTELDITIKVENGETVAFLSDNGTQTFIDTNTGKTK